MFRHTGIHCTYTLSNGQFFGIWKEDGEKLDIVRILLRAEVISRLVKNENKFIQKIISYYGFDKYKHNNFIEYTEQRKQYKLITKEMVNGEQVNIYNYHEDKLNIINEEAQAYYSGAKSVEDVVKVIQNRVQIYVDENR